MSNAKVQNPNECQNQNDKLTASALKLFGLI
jgi:hypothetical protein